ACARGARAGPRRHRMAPPTPPRAGPHPTSTDSDRRPPRSAATTTASFARLTTTTAPEPTVSSSQMSDVQRSFDVVPHNKALGIDVVELARDHVIFRLPYADKLVGNPDTGVLHGGAITALLDACSGGSVFAALPALTPIATLDLRIDYLRPAE